MSMMMSYATKTKKKKQRQPVVQEDHYSSGEEEDVGEKLKKIEEEKKRKRSLWGSHTMEKSLDPPKGNDDESSDSDPDEPIASSPFARANQIFMGQDVTNNVEQALANNRRPLYDDNDQRTFTEMNCPDPNDAEEYFRRWGDFYAKNRRLPNDTELAGMSMTAKPSAPPRRKKKKSPDLPANLANFTYMQKDRLLVGEEVNNKNKENPGPYTVAQYIVFGREGCSGYSKVDLRQLSSDHLRKVAANFGCKNVSSAPMFECRMKMAIRKSAGTTHENLEIPNPVTTASERKINTYLRCLNAVFSAVLIDRFIGLNDAKARAEMEEAGGGSPFKKFCQEAAALVNDTERDEFLGTLLKSGDGEDDDRRLHELCEENGYNLNDFNQVDGKSCIAMVTDTFKALDRIKTAMTQSGHHSTDVWEYCRRTFLRVRKNVEVPAVAAYYLSILVKDHPGIEGNFAQCLAAGLGSDSMNLPTSTKECKTGKGTAHCNTGKNDSATSLTTKTSTAREQAFLDKFDEATQAFNGAASADVEQKKRLADLLSKKAQEDLAELDEKRIERNWDEYYKLSDRVLKLKKEVFDLEEEGDYDGHSVKHQLLLNLSSRVRTIEVMLEIEEEKSIVMDLLRKEGKDLIDPSTPDY